MINNEIGMYAGMIWQYLESNENNCTVKELKKSLLMKDKDLYIALGWLCRENKAMFSYINDIDCVSIIY